EADMTERFPNYEDLKSAGTLKKRLHGLTQRGFPLAIKKQAQKNGRPKSPKMPCVLFYREGSVALGLLGILPDEISNRGAEDDAEAHNQNTCKNHFINEHVRAPRNHVLFA